MHPNPELVGGVSFAAALLTVLALVWAIRKAPRPEVPDWILEELIGGHVQLRCRHCQRTAQVIMPTRCEGAILIREIFTGQHRLCVAQPVMFV